VSKGLFIEGLTWKEAEAKLKDFEIILIPVGARLKEHGLHLPLNNDWLIAEYLTRRVVDKCQVIALPTVPYGYYPAFIEYPGSVNIEMATFRDYMIDICQSFSRHGIRKFYVLNTGISTNRALEPAREILFKDNIIMEYTNLADAVLEAENKVRQQEEGTHADEIETSMMLYIAPEVVNMEKAEKDIHKNLGPGGLSRNPETDKGVYSPTGAWGDPTLATVEKGEIVTEALVEHIISFLTNFAKADFEPSPLELKYFI
jgi:creatinine amidohydrolase